MNTKTPTFCEKTAEKNKVKDGYPPKKNRIILEFGDTLYFEWG